MNRHTTVKKSLILLVAILMCVAVFLTACNGKAFKPSFKAPTGSKPIGNGGIAVQYDEWIYYVNGFEASTNATNTYVDTEDAPRVGSVVRIKIADIPGIFKINEDEDLKSTEKTKAIAEQISEKTEIVVPHIYYSANSTTPAQNGLYIFNDRLYILTPNDKLTAGGSTQTNQSLLMSFDLAGGKPQRHFTFESNSAQIWLYEKDGKVMATYLMNSKLYVLDVADNEKSVSTEITGEDETIEAVNYDEKADCLFFLDADGSICKLAMGAKEKEVIVNNATDSDKEVSTLSYTIASVNAGYVYYKKADSNNSDINNIVLYYVNTNAKTEGKYVSDIAINTTELKSTPVGWKDGKAVAVKSVDGYHGIELIVSKDCKNSQWLLLPGYNESSVEIKKIVGDDLYYTAGGVTYVKNLNEFENKEFGVAYGNSSILTNSGNWYLPDRVVVNIDGKEHIYVFSLATGSVSVVEFDKETKKDSTSANFTKTVIVEDED